MVRGEEIKITAGVVGVTIVDYPRILLQDAAQHIAHQDFGVAIVVAHVACEITAQQALTRAFARRSITELETPVRKLFTVTAEPTFPRAIPAEIATPPAAVAEIMPLFVTSANPAVVGPPGEKIAMPFAPNVWIEPALPTLALSTPTITAPPSPRCCIDPEFVLTSAVPKATTAALPGPEASMFPMFSTVALFPAKTAAFRLATTAICGFAN